MMARFKYWEKVEGRSKRQRQIETKVVCSYVPQERQGISHQQQTWFSLKTAPQVTLLMTFQLSFSQIPQNHKKLIVTYNCCKKTIPRKSTGLQAYEHKSRSLHLTHSLVQNLTCTHNAHAKFTLKFAFSRTREQHTFNFASLVVQQFYRQSYTTKYLS